MACDLGICRLERTAGASTRAGDHSWSTGDRSCIHCTAHCFYWGSRCGLEICDEPNAQLPGQSLLRFVRLPHVWAVARPAYPWHEFCHALSGICRTRPAADDSLKLDLISLVGVSLPAP